MPPQRFFLLRSTPATRRACRDLVEEGRDPHTSARHSSRIALLVRRRILKQSLGREIGLSSTNRQRNAVLAREYL